ncbi:hypothetical protein ACRAWB_10090 [Leifsonia poae]|uniref:hypothetical protein n=1 Tax=Leifsonia poae TaxID=110933 RepID=UPI003D687606
MSTATPLLLGPNQPLDRPYRGGAGIARFRGTEQPGPFTPEDFVGSTTEVFAGGGVGLTVLPDGTTLREAVAADPVRFLGEEHVRFYGPRTMLLVKLLDTAERLFVHYHPDDAFAAAHLNSPWARRRHGPSSRRRTTPTPRSASGTRSPTPRCAAGGTGRTPTPWSMR